VVRRREGGLLRQALQKLLFSLWRALGQMLVRTLELLHAVKTGDRSSVTARELQTLALLLSNPLPHPHSEIVRANYLSALT